MDIRLQELPFDLDGLHFRLKCNMNVLADVQEAYGGDMGPALSTRGTLRSSLEFLAAMLNDYADEQGWLAPGVTSDGAVSPPLLARRYTARALGRRLRREQVPMTEIFRLVTAALTPEKAEEDAAEPEDEPGN